MCALKSSIYNYEADKGTNVIMFSQILQGFSWTKSKRLRTSLQCVVVKGNTEGVRPQLEDCIIGTNDTWVHKQVSTFIKRITLCLIISVVLN